ncbi:MAG: nucleoside-diphosphate sugar epimerase/dehydratase [Candidatus Cryptobacteroides sp.]|nr:nucleoside-diphosphate sugar epimerase/dehydratase [Candidatus Cryptobacteroides sp.]
MGILQKLSNFYFSKKALPYWCILLIDCAVVAFSFYLTYYLRYGGIEFAMNFWPLTAGILVSLIPFVASFRIFHTYTGIVRYSSFVDLQRVAIASFISALIVWALGFGLDYFWPEQTFLLIPDAKSIFLIFVICTVLLWTERVVVKRLFDSFNTDNAIPVVIYGTKAGGISVAKSIISVKKKKYTVKAFISDGKEMQGAYLMGKPVYLNEKGLAGRLSEMGVKAILVSPLKAEKFRDNTSMVDEVIAAGMKIMMMSGGEEWDGKSALNHEHFQEVDIEDLLPREKIQIDMDAIGALLSGKRILITGAAGSIGSEMVRQVAKFNPAEMILIDQAETPMHDIRLMMSKDYPLIKNETIVTSITNRDHMESIFSQHKPEYVFHAAAYKHVPMMEDNPGIAVQNNIYGTKVIADLAVKYGTKKFVMISTDKAVNPTNVMGCSKRICEIYCQSLNRAIQSGEVKGVTQFVTTRFGNVLGSNGSVIPLFKKQIRSGGPVTVTHPDIIRYFMLIPEACQLVLEAGTMGKGGEIFVFDMGKPVKIVDLAKRMIALSGAKNVEIKFTGLRDGEKLYEEVLNDKESTVPTVNPKIMVAKVREYDYATACENERRLMEESKSFDDMAVVKVMKEIVPEYKSKQSKYEVLDRAVDA